MFWDVEGGMPVDWETLVGDAHFVRAFVVRGGERITVAHERDLASALHADQAAGYEYRDSATGELCEAALLVACGYCDGPWKPAEYSEWHCYYCGGC